MNRRIRFVLCFVGLNLFATAVLAQQPDLLIVEAKVSSSIGPGIDLVAGDFADISMDFRNTGEISASDIIVRMYEGDPSKPENQIGDDELIEQLDVGDTRRVRRTWDTLGKAGLNEIYVLVDPDNHIDELNETNNTWKIGLEVYLLGDFNYDGKIDPEDKATLDAAFGSQEGDRNWNWVCDIWKGDQPLGIAPNFRVLSDNIIDDADVAAFNSLMDLDLQSKAASVTFHAEHVVFKPVVEQYDYRANAGDSIAIMVELPTVGTAEVGELMVRFLDNDQQIGDRPIMKSNGGIGIAYIIWHTEGLEPGVHEISVIADPDDEKVESSEDNNTAWKTVMLEYTGIDSDFPSTQPVAFELLQNFPNPFNPTTIIPFSIPTWDQGPTDSRLQIACTLAIYDLTGQRICSFVVDLGQSGMYEIVWDGKDAIGHKVASGIYFYRLVVGHGQWSSSKKMILIR